MFGRYWRRRSVDQKTWSEENRKHGSVYFIKDDERDMVKIGHSSTPVDRMRALQVGSAGRLRLIGIMAAPRAFEATLHQAFREGHMRGEWFFDREIISLFLHDVTSGMPFCRTAWEIVETKSIFSEWDDQKKRHVTHRFDPGTARWELVA